MPAIAPWEGDQSQFALTDYGRSAECARQRLCSVCNTLVPRGPVWRVVGAAESAAIGEALAAGRPYRNMAATLEAPGHRATLRWESRGNRPPSPEPEPEPVRSARCPSR